MRVRRNIRTDAPLAIMGAPSVGAGIVKIRPPNAIVALKLDLFQRAEKERGRRWWAPPSFHNPVSSSGFY
jgi:hypothetical protein